MEKRVLTVLRSGGEYGPEHVQAIQRQLAKWAPSARLTCLSDVDVPGVERIPLKSDWPGWWAKMELFRGDMPEDFFYTDLDNVFLGPLDELLEAKKFTADIGFSFFRVVPGAIHEAVYNEFWDNPAVHMGEWDLAHRVDGKFGDAAYLRWRCGLDPARWEDTHPGQVINIANITLPCPWHLPPVVWTRAPNVRVMLCGGKRRRPWLSPAQAIQRAYWCREK